jgi:hypothetical protein
MTSHSEVTIDLIKTIIRGGFMMTNREELNEKQVEEVVGGALKWCGGAVWPKDNPSAIYHYTDYYACIAWIQANWTGKQTEDTLVALMDAGLVTQ